MPKHPSYPAGHGVVAGCAEVILSYFFPPEAHRLHELAEECAVSRLYAGVHYPIDNEQGLSLGRYVGEIIVEKLKKQKDDNFCYVDYSNSEYLGAKLPPPPYKQVISYTEGHYYPFAEDFYSLDKLTNEIKN